MKGVGKRDKTWFFIPIILIVGLLIVIIFIVFVYEEDLSSNSLTNIKKILGKNILDIIFKKKVILLDETDLETLPYVPGEVIFKVKKPININDKSEIEKRDIAVKRIRGINASFVTTNDISINNILENNNAIKIKKVLKNQEVFKVTINSKKIDKIIEDFKKNSEIEYVEPNYLATTSFIPNDALYSNQWAHQRTQAELGWDTEQGNRDITIAIIDSGVDYTHEDLSKNMLGDCTNGCPESTGYDFVDIDLGLYNRYGYYPIPEEDYIIIDNDPSDYTGHGTHVAGIAAAVGNNEVGVSGVCPQCAIMPVRAGFSLNTSSSYIQSLLEYDDITNSIYYAADNGATIISMSFGSTSSSQLLADAVNYAYNKGLILVAAAGNANTNFPYYPAAYNNVIAVSSTSQEDTKAFYSNYGDWVDVSAPGGDSSKDNMILSTVPKVGILSNQTGYSFLQGTSMATPYVAGLYGLVMSHYNNLSRDEIIDIVKGSSDNIDNINIDYAGLLGFGRVNNYKSMNFLLVPNIRIEYFNYSDNYSENDINGFIDPGENIDIVITLKNYGKNAELVNITLTSTDPYVTIYENSSYYNIGNMNTREIKNSDKFLFKISEDTPYGQVINFSLNINAIGYSNSFNLYKQVEVPLLKGWPFFISTWMVGRFSTPTIVNIDEDNSDEILFSVGNNLYIKKGDGSNYLNSPISLGETAGGIWCTTQLEYTSKDIVVGDIDGDNKNEIVANINAFAGIPCGKLIAWNSEDLSFVNGFPKVLGDERGKIHRLALADMDDNPQDLEIITIVHSVESKIYIIDGNGLILNSWIIPRLDWARTVELAVGDVNNDTNNEIFVSYALTDPIDCVPSSLVAYYSNGTIIPGWPKTFGSCLSQPVLANLDGGQDLEVIVEVIYDSGSYGVTALKSNGNVVSGWENNFNGGYDTSITDLENDGEIEVITKSTNRVNLFNSDGTLKWSKYINYIEAGNQPSVISIDNQSRIIFPILSNGRGSIIALDNQGNTLPGFPILVGDGIRLYQSGLGDFDGDSDSEVMILVGYNLTDYGFYAYNLDWIQNKTFKTEWSQFQHDAQHTGNYHFNFVGIPDTSPPATITNLQSPIKNTTWIYWNWNNPSDPDFNSAIIYIDGLNVANTTNNYYYIQGLLCNTTHTILVNTKDNSGNINTTAVNSTITTLECSPTIIINFPRNNTFINHLNNVIFNYTLIDVPDLFYCHLWIRNRETELKLNQTHLTPQSQVNNVFYLNLSEDTFLWTISCNNTNGTNVFNSVYNLIIDITLPFVNITFPRNNSQVANEFIFNYTINDSNYDKCYYNFLKSGSWVYLTNQTIECHSSKSDLLNPGTYDLYLWAEDKAGNTNLNIISLSVICDSGLTQCSDGICRADCGISGVSGISGGGGGGGGGGCTPKCRNRQCGPNGCGEFCGSFLGNCSAGFTCSNNGTCVVIFIETKGNRTERQTLLDIVTENLPESVEERSYLAFIVLLIILIFIIIIVFIIMFSRSRKRNLIRRK